TDRQEIAALQTLAGSMMGTPAYMPPEQALGKLDLIDERADIYALGAILYELLTLERAIQGESQIAVILNVVKGNIVPPATRAPGRSIPREMADAAMKCLATRREDRYQAVADLRADISLFIEGREAWIPVCSMDFARDPLDPRFDVVWSEKDWPQNAHWVKGVAQATIRDGQLHVSGGPEWTTYSALHWREEVGEETRVAATLVNEPGGETTAKSIVRVCVSGDGAHGYRFVFCGAPRFDVELDTAANGYYELLCHWPGKLDPNRASWDIVVERAGPWLRATVDGVKVIEYFDPVPLSGPVHRTFGFSGQNYTLTRISAWRRRMPETASILEAGRVLLENKHFDEAARFFADQVATPRGTPLDDEAQFLHGLALEGLGALDDALAAYRRAAESTNRSLAASASLRAARILVGRSNIGAAGRAALRATQLDAGVPVPEALSAALSALLRSLDPPKTNLHDREGVAALVEAMRGHLDGRSQNIASLEPLRGIPFRSMEVQHNSICDLSPLAGMPLESLQCATNRISDLEPLRGMPLRKLWCYGNPLDDLAPLAGMPLEVLHCGNTRVCDLSPLKGMPLKDLRCYHTPVRDLSPLKGMPLTWLDLGGVLVGYLAPLSGMPLSWLSVQCAYRVADLSPLKGAPLRTLFIAGCPQVTDLTPLTEMALEQLSFTPDYIEKGLDVVRSMKSLRLIGDNSTTLMDAETFWSKYDAGEFKLLSKAVGPIRQAEDGTLTLRALDAQLHGQVMWLPAGPRTGSIHGWTNESDWLSWDFELGRGGIFEVEILYSRDFVNGGGAYAVAVGEQNLEAEVQYTQGWEFFDCFSPGVLRIPVGRHSLSLEVVRITGPCGLMGLASITLKPTGRKG
ncbi:MAG: hypothetical protein FJ290_18520, partial [Planctomycetes bacterium]|nr:hypothetical protein [Planctomycetota bacterium]